MIANKIQLRREMLARRGILALEQVEQRSREINKRLGMLEPLKQAGVVMAYLSIKNEVDLSDIMVELKERNIVLLVPRVEGSELQAVEFKSWDECRQGPFGIREPVGDAYPLQKIEVVLVPGVAFDASGHRLGYGKGFYDRFLRQLAPSTFLCGVAYEFQVVDSIFPDQNDVPLHWVVTEQSEVAVDMSFF
ncbi:MAG TPA: 5-formyltetrahydrofolate cyclo-ligase [Syntrophomonadaceae bacterium]|nr:5-formyltetrahydrofolate cyclo-ligase [Syntrophomonadaceae bacterium]